MKKIFTLLSFALLSIAVFAAAPKQKSMLTIQSFNRGDMKIVIDDNRFEPNGNFMRLQGLRPGYHTIKIYQEKTGSYFNLIGKRYQMVYNSSVTVRPRTNLTITVDRNGRTFLKETRFDGWNNGNGRNNRNEDNRDWGYNNNDNGYGWGDDYKRGQDFEYDTDGRQGDYNWDDRSNNNNDRYNNAMNDREFSRILESINKEWLETNKMKSASQVLSTSFFTSAQVKQMALLFSFENNRVDLAKQAYSKVVDQRNFMSTMNDVFSFQTSRDELARFIRNAR
ncbi:MAG TPA: DUF4476 domain-containing protein [Chitinophagaceae bacterium]